MDYRRRRYGRQHGRGRLVMFIVLGVLLLIIIGQFIYRTDHLLPLQRLDGVWVGGASKVSAAKTIENDYTQRMLPVKAPGETKPITTLTFAQLGIRAHATPQVAALDYPWYWRLVPSSLLWYQLIQPRTEPSFSLDTTAAKTALQTAVAPKVTRSAGTTVVHTVNFVKTSQDTGVTARTLDVSGSITSLQHYVDGASPTYTVAVLSNPAPVTYDNTFGTSDAALEKVMKNYADSHTGTYAAAMVELDGQHRYAAYNSSAVMTTASTYKLFVAYSILSRIENGTWHWSDETSAGFDRRTCFDRMIELSDNNCAEAFLFAIGFSEETKEAHELGAVHTTFANGNITSTASDELLLLGRLATGQILDSQTDRDIWLSAMKQNVYRDGIPAGIPSATVADKVGFLDALLHDAAIVYSPKGTYVLIIMTNNATWGDIANLAGNIEAAR